MIALGFSPLDTSLINDYTANNPYAGLGHLI